VHPKESGVTIHAQIEQDSDYMSNFLSPWRELKCLLHVEAAID
jgi:hypothetical protein